MLRSLPSGTPRRAHQAVAGARFRRAPKHVFVTAHRHHPHIPEAGLGTYLGDELDPAHPRHREIDEHPVRAPRVHARESIDGVPRLDDLEADARESIRDETEERRIVVDDQHATAPGADRRNVVSTPGLCGARLYQVAHRAMTSIDRAAARAGQLVLPVLQKAQERAKSAARGSWRRARARAVQDHAGGRCMGPSAASSSSRRPTPSDAAE